MLISMLRQLLPLYLIYF